MAAFDPRIVSERWADWRARVDLDEYDQRWVRMEESGRASHGEADLIAALGVAPVLDAGCGMGRVAIELARPTPAVTRRSSPGITTTWPRCSCHGGTAWWPCRAT
jgi:SAM-dependent methyltransferase